MKEDKPNFDRIIESLIKPIYLKNPTLYKGKGRKKELYNNIRKNVLDYYNKLETEGIETELLEPKILEWYNKINEIIKEYNVIESQLDILFLLEYYNAQQEEKNRISEMIKDSTGEDSFFELLKSLLLLNKYPDNKIEIEIKHINNKKEATIIKSSEIIDVIKKRLEDYFWYLAEDPDDPDSRKKLDFVKVLEEVFDDHKKCYGKKGRRKKYPDTFIDLIYSLYHYFNEYTEMKNESERNKHLLIFKIIQPYGIMNEISYKQDKIKDILGRIQTS